MVYKQSDPGTYEKGKFIPDMSKGKAVPLSIEAPDAGYLKETKVLKELKPFDHQKAEACRRRRSGDPADCVKEAADIPDKLGKHPQMLFNKEKQNKVLDLLYSNVKC